MRKKKPTPPDKLTVDRVYGNLALLTFSLISLFISAILTRNQLLNLKGYIGIGFFVFFLFSLVFLVADISVYYGSQTWSWFKNNYPKYKWFYYLSFLVLTLIGLIYLGYNKLDRQTFWAVTIGFFGAAILGAIGWVLIKIITAKKKR